MNNQMPYYGNPNNNYNPGHNMNDMMFDRLNNRINRLERQVRMLENRLNMLEGGPTFLKNNTDNDDNMYML